MNTLSSTTAALERVWTAIRTIHPDVRPAAIVVYLHSRNDRRGHYWQESWLDRSSAHLDEIHISSHILKESPAQVLCTLLHEAAHSIAVARSIQDVSRQNRYHNKHFRTLAIELGLQVKPKAGIGITTPNLTDQTSHTFKNVLEELASTLDLYQHSRTTGNNKGKAKTSMLKLTCPTCSRIIRASPKTLALGPILCAPCDTAFQKDQDHNT